MLIFANMVIKAGFEISGIEYGWKDRSLFRLPQLIGCRAYSLKKLDLIPIGQKYGYRVGGKRKTIDQLKDITQPMTRIISTIKNNDMPF